MAMTVIDAAATFRDDPAKARSAPTVTATLANGRARLSAGPFNWDADLPSILGGENLAPSPTAYLLGALAGCAVAFLRDTLAPEFGVEIHDASAAASAVSDLRGLIGVDGAAPDLTDLKLDISMTSSSPQDRVDAMLAAWRERCPIYLALLKPNAIELTTSANQAAGAGG
ncbi:MAG: OsmC family protein [Chloroflexota bacterium]